MNLRPIIYLLTALAILFHKGAIAQKLPSEQKQSVFAPAGIRIDGKANEWTGGYQAFNKATLINYTLANDDENLYLVVSADQRDIIGKILSGGITLQIKNRNKGQKLSPVSLTFPIIDRMEKSAILTILKTKEGDQDSLLTLANQKLSANSKDITLSGLKGITDSVISVYNDLGIKAASKADAKRAWTYELQLPLKYFRDLIDPAGAFDYKIIVNGVKMESGVTVMVGRAISSVSLSGVSMDGGGVDAFSPTDLSATYTLAKK